MATTPNYGWVTPAPTDYLVDLPADFETFADAVDATVKALNPGTTAGDVDYYTSGTAKARLGIGTAGQVLTVNSGATAPEWATISAGGMTALASGSLSGSTVSLTSISGSYKDLVLVLRDFYWTTSGLQFQFRLNGDANTNRYLSMYETFETGGSLSTGAIAANKGYLTFGNVNNADSNAHCFIKITDYADTATRKGFQVLTVGQAAGGADSVWAIEGQYNQAGAITAIEVAPEYGGGGTFAGGTYVLYGVN